VEGVLLIAVVLVLICQIVILYLMVDARDQVFQTRERLKHPFHLHGPVK
jgi:hypothetical protein